MSMCQLLLHLLAFWPSGARRQQLGFYLRQLCTNSYFIPIRIPTTNCTTKSLQSNSYFIPIRIPTTHTMNAIVSKTKMSKALDSKPATAVCSTQTFRHKFQRECGMWGLMELKSHSMEFYRFRVSMYRYVWTNLQSLHFLVSEGVWENGNLGIFKYPL